VSNYTPVECTVGISHTREEVNHYSEEMSRYWCIYYNTEYTKGNIYNMRRQAIYTDLRYTTKWKAKWNVQK